MMNDARQNPAMNTGRSDDDRLSPELQAAWEARMHELIDWATQSRFSKQRAQSLWDLMNQAWWMAFYLAGSDIGTLYPWLGREHALHASVADMSLNKSPARKIECIQFLSYWARDLRTDLLQEMSKEGMSLKEIADALGTSKQTIHAQLSRAKLDRKLPPLFQRRLHQEK
jgi:Sigma-70, region 4